ncbi:NAD-dependent epimerase/dehydratase family protein [Chryseobacterium sp. SNU WT5]|uniref:NAD-dependent epimerase/dehydratase family protein n=1 Tax=Chryseobacterium sp. SNU WT5 TaxID=2594269 RepID=UPI00117E6377|nr:NAD-dependent epimerase/dehydratase family protein [Chryseobacterium sp. SNU WT5]QDP85928.1 NAD-dependent epimerase/dehydratase family protein [Chryseobacterium sp. SNU WT5]
MVLVTGATGILGRVIVLELLKQGKEVRVTKRPSSDIQEVLKSYRFYTDQPEMFFNKINWVDVDFEDSDSIDAALRQVTEVYHCAAHVSFHPDDRRSMYHTNIEGTRQLLFSSQNSAVQKFCFISSTAVLDGMNEKGEISEDSDYNSKVNHSPYARSKHFAEMEVWRASAEGLNTIILNPGVIIGSGNWYSSSGEIFHAFSKYPYAMSGSTAYVDVRDVGKIAISLMEKNRFGERYVLISESKKILEVANFVRGKLGKSKAKVISKNFLTIGYGLHILFGWLIPPLRMLNKVNLETVTSHPVISNQKIRQELDYQFIPVFESLDFHLKNYISDHNKL